MKMARYRALFCIKPSQLPEEQQLPLLLKMTHIFIAALTLSYVNPLQRDGGNIML